MAPVFKAHLRERVLRPRSGACQLDVAEFALPIEGHLAGFALAFQGKQLIACIRCSRKTQYYDRHRWRRFGYLPAALVKHCAHAAILTARDDRIARSQGTPLHKDRGDCAASFLDAGLNHEASRKPGPGRSQLEHFGLQQNGLEQLVDPLPGARGDVHKDGLSAPLLGDHVMFGKLGADAVRMILLTATTIGTFAARAC
jgi:hypothetical protein